MADPGTLQDAFIDELRDAYDAEKQLTKALPKMARAASSPDLRAAFEHHLEETRGQIERLEQVFETAERMVRHGVAGIFPFIVGFPDEPDESVEATLSVIKRLRRMSPDFEVSVYFYQPYPGSPIADLVWRRGYPKPRTLDEWATFDYVGSRGSWVTDAKWERVQRFKFYQHHAFGRRRRRLATLPLRWLAKARVAADMYRVPIEKLIVETLRPEQALS